MEEFPGRRSVLEPGTLALFARAERALAAAGASVEPRQLSVELLRANAAHAHVMNMESAEALTWERDHARALLSPALRERMDWGAIEPPARFAEGRAAFAAARASFAGWSAGCDAILTPAAPGEAPQGLGATGDPACTSLWTLLHAPCVTVPAGEGPNGMPLGVQMVGRAGEEAGLLALAEFVRRALAP